MILRSRKPAPFVENGLSDHVRVPAGEALHELGEPISERRAAETSALCQTVGDHHQDVASVKLHVSLSEPKRWLIARSREDQRAADRQTLASSSPGRKEYGIRQAGVGERQDLPGGVEDDTLQGERLEEIVRGKRSGDLIEEHAWLRVFAGLAAVADQVRDEPGNEGALQARTGSVAEGHDKPARPR